MTYEVEVILTPRVSKRPEALQDLVHGDSLIPEVWLIIQSPAYSISYGHTFLFED